MIACLIGGVTEPGLYGIGMRYKRSLVGIITGGFVGGIYAGLTGITAYALIPVSSVLALIGYAGGSGSNFVNAIITAVISFAVAAITTYLFGFK